MEPHYKQVLKRELEALDKHVAEVRAVLDSRQLLHPSAWEAMRDEGLNLNARVINAARELLKEMDALARLDAQRASEGVSP